MNYCNCPNCRTDNCPAGRDDELLSLIEFVRNRAANACEYEYNVSDSTHSVRSLDCHDLLVKWRERK